MVHTAHIEVAGRRIEFVAHTDVPTGYRIVADGVDPFEVDTIGEGMAKLRAATLKRQRLAS